MVCQTFYDFEVLVMDDGSTDDTRAIVESFNDKRIFYNWRPNSGGPAAPRNRGLKISKGRFIAFLDSDDIWYREKLSECYKFAQLDYDVIYHGLEIIDRNRSTKGKNCGSWQVRSPVLIDLLMRGNAIPLSSAVVKSSIIKLTSGFLEAKNIVASEDYNLWLQISKYTERFYYHPVVLGSYFSDGTGISKKRDTSISYSAAVFPFISELNTYQKEFVEARVNYTKLKYEYTNNGFQFVRKHALRSILKGPIQLRIKALFMYLRSLLLP